MPNRNNYSKKSLKRSKRQFKRNKKQSGGKVTLPRQYFDPDHSGNFLEQQPVSQGAVSHGVVDGNDNHQAGPDLHPTMKQTGGGLPIEYFGGDSGRFFEAGSPELQNCTSAYGVLNPVSHGVVLDVPDGSRFDPDGLWMGPNLAASDGINMKNVNMTGGRRKRRNRKNRKTKKTKRNMRSKRNNRTKKNKRNKRK
tara:strand:- start:1159 stop:1743 length:585 start_codon:yes stop_codon:yes gene_type:complete